MLIKILILWIVFLIGVVTGLFMSTLLRAWNKDYPQIEGHGL